MKDNESYWNDNNPFFVFICFYISPQIGLFGPCLQNRSAISYFILFIECFRLKCNRFKMSKVQKINFTKFTKFLFFSRIVLHMVLKCLCSFI